MRAPAGLRGALGRKEARRGALVALVAVVLAWVALSPDDGGVEAADRSATTDSTTTGSTTTGATSTERTTTTRSSATEPDPPTTASSAPPSPPVEVAALLGAVDVAPEGASDAYDRDRFGSGWIDADGDGCDTRAEVLIAESTTPAQVDPSGCLVVAGDWVSSYDGYSTPDPTELEVDHVVALAEAWRSGADRWSDERRLAFANDLDHPGALVAVTAATNRSKSDRDPASWQPPNRDAWCGFAQDWLEVKARWGLTADEAELRALRNMLRGCELTTRPTVVPAPAPAMPHPPPAPTTVAPSPAAGAGCDPAYPGICIPSPPPDLDCGDIPHRRFEVRPPDPHRFDGEGDGRGCES